MISEIMKKMIAYSEGSLRDINHFVKVWTFAKTIGELENIDKEKQTVLEIAAIVHDIACPSLRKRFGKSDGKMQEIEGMPMAEAFLDGFGLTKEQMDRVVYLVGHHHSTDCVDGIDYQILLEADYIVNAGESGYSMEDIRNTRESLFRTVSGKAVLDSIFPL